MTATLNTIVNAVQPYTDKGIDLVQKVDTFYNNAWTKLIIIITILFSVAGIIFPLILNFILQRAQKKELKASEEVLKKEIATKTVEIKNQISEDLVKIIDDKFKEYEGNVLLLKGEFYLAKESYRDALSTFITAAICFLRCNDYQNLQNVLNLILYSCLSNLSFEDISHVKEVYDNDLDLFLGQLKEKDEKRILLTSIQLIKDKMRSLPKTKPKLTSTEETAQEKPKEEK
jgi:hypothetical protein